MLDEAEHREIVAEICADAAARVDAGVSRPSLVIVGGQPGAGKSVTRHAEMADLASAGQPLVVDLDELRAWHPRQPLLERANDKTAAAHTGPDAGRWLRAVLDWGRARRCNVVLESTLRRPEQVVATVTVFADAGYEVGVNVVATHPVVSLLGTVERYEHAKRRAGVGRWVPTAHHDECVKRIPETLAAVRRATAPVNVGIRTRDGDVLPAADPEAAMRRRHDEPLGRSQRQRVEARVGEVKITAVDDRGDDEVAAALAVIQSRLARPPSDPASSARPEAMQ